MKKIFFTLALICITLSIPAQTFVVPTNYTLKTEADLSKYEKDAIKCADWLVNTPLNTDKSKRVNATKFLKDYVKAYPAIKAIVKLKVTPFLKNSELATVYLAIWTKNFLILNHVNKKEEFVLRATNKTLEFYVKNKIYIGKAKKINKFLKMKKKGTLDSYLKKKI